MVELATLLLLLRAPFGFVAQLGVIALIGLVRYQPSKRIGRRKDGRFELAPQDGQGYVFRDHVYSMGSDGGRRHDAAIA